MRLTRPILNHVQVVANEPTRVNNFDYSTDPTQTRCPYAAHLRKTNPRSDLQDPVVNIDPHRIIRRGIPFGPEMSFSERHLGKTHHLRGLAFACYQADINQGFHFSQQCKPGSFFHLLLPSLNLPVAWANNPKFPPNKPVSPGFDIIIGQNGNNERDIFGTDPQVQNAPIVAPIDFSVILGGEYFFIPSVSALKDELGAGSS
jgi:hypothetical protein